jgi:hypothetical protein
MISPSRISLSYTLAEPQANVPLATDLRFDLKGGLGNAVAFFQRRFPEIELFFTSNFGLPI